MSQIICASRGIECSCPAGICRSAPTPAPVIRPSTRLQAVAIFIGLTIIAVPVAYASLSRLDEVCRVQQLDNQENTHVARAR